MLNQHISKIAIIGSGIMGSGIACHFANIGVQVLLLDIIPKSLNDVEKNKGLRDYIKHSNARIVNDSLEQIIKSKPSPLYHKIFRSRITTGNIEDDLHLIEDVDWIMEVVTERLDIKKIVFEKIENYRKPRTIVTSNTSGIPIKQMSEGRSDDFQKHFCGTHFFNPARYLKLFEIIPGPKTSKEIVEFLNEYGSKFLGKTSVIAKDTPTFIGNRIGIFGIQNIFHSVKDMELTIDDIVRLTLPVIGRPKSATFRTADVVGLDTLVHVTNGLSENCKKDEEREIFKLPPFVETLINKNWLGDKTKQGFYKKVVKDGKKEILTLDLKTLEYRAKQKASFPVLAATKAVDDLTDRFKILVNGKDKAGEFYRKSFAAMFAYVSNRVPEISDDLYKIDDAMKAGFGWEHGPFKIWDAVGVSFGLSLIKKEGLSAAKWVSDMIDNDIDNFYSVKDGISFYYNLSDKKHVKIPGQDAFIILDNIRESKEVFKNSGVVIEDLGDGILNCEFRSKMNTIGGDVLNGLNKAVDLAEKNYQGRVIGNQGANFSVGANIGMIFMMAVEQEDDELNAAIKYFQDTMMRMRYCSIPTVAAPHGMTLGGGCELSMRSSNSWY
jgi:3-hydroxyacyl-CoA dehydrogenase